VSDIKLTAMLPMSLAATITILDVPTS
jgi:hypothetical protein